MPELPEIEVLAQELRGRVPGLVFSGIQTDRASIFKTDPRTLGAAVSGRRVLGVSRRGKFLYLELDSRLRLWFHLGMTGQLFWGQNGSGDSHVHFTASFEGMADKLIFRDARKFGKIFLTQPESHSMPEGIQGLGPEPFDLSAREFFRIFQKRTGRIKSLLLNQRLIAGLGNIYADECLFRAGINPKKRPYRIARARLEALRDAVLETLSEAIRHGGSSIDDYIHTDLGAGAFQNFHRVYGRRGKDCPACGTQIARTVLSGRSSFFCPKCQV